MVRKKGGRKKVQRPRRMEINLFNSYKRRSEK
jgi:hypothetical protein